jgi:hypothetical protein
MQRIVTTFMKLAAGGLLAVGLSGVAGCYAEAYGGAPASYPSASFVATEEPIYYNGQASYYYGGRWFYRDGGRWGFYRSEPSYLRQYRSTHPAYGTRGGARGGARGGGRGARR